MKALLESKDVTVLIVNYRGADDTINCLRSLHKLVEAPGRIIVIDNNSNDGSVDKIFFAWREFAAPSIVKAENIEQTQLKSRAVILMMPQNGGYAYGNNAGMRLAFRDSTCKAVWVLNNDTEVDCRALSELCKKVYTEKCIVGSPLVYHHDKKTIQCLAGSRINKFIGTTSHIYEGMNIEDVHKISISDIERKLDALNGASILISRGVIKEIRRFNEYLFLYYEDIDFSIRASKSGHMLLWADNSIVYHKEGSSTCVGKGKKNKFIDYLSLRNRIVIMKYHYPSALLLVILSYFVILICRIKQKQYMHTPYILKAVFDGLYLEKKKHEQKSICN